jgi:hypothetical protein
MTKQSAMQCSDYGTYAIKIRNSAADINIFPVLVTPINDADEWLQAAFQVPEAKIGQLTYAHKFQYRMYIKPILGIAPGQHVTLTLPLYSLLVDRPDGTKPDECIDWWNGGRVYVYTSPVAAGAPPALTRNFGLDQPNVVIPLTPGPACVGCPMPNPPIYKCALTLPSNEPAAVTEFTVGAIDKGAIYKMVPDLRIVDLPATAHHMASPDAMPGYGVVIG